MNIRYMRNFYSVGRGTHIVEAYSGYTAEQGLTGLVARRESPRIAECLKGLYMPPEQLKQVKTMARDRNDGIALDDGTFRNN